MVVNTGQSVYFCFMTKEESRLTFKQLSIYLSKWWLISEGSDKWLEDSEVMTVWNVCLFSVLVFCFSLPLIRTLFESALMRVTSAALAFRCYEIAGVAWLLVTVVIMAITYYRRLLLTSLDLRFKSLSAFWLQWVALFSFLYQNVSRIAPYMFYYPHPVVKYSPVVTQIDLVTAYKEQIHFLVYSVATAVTTTVPFIASSSLIISALNVIEVIGSLLMSAVFVATLVNKTEVKKLREGAGGPGPRHNKSGCPIFGWPIHKTQPIPRVPHSCSFIA
jgi:hypothetical protein